jgi:flagellar protein FliO/FliZ
LGGDFGTVTIKVASSLILIIGLIIGLFYLLKRLRLSSLSLMAYPEMRLIGTLNLAPKRAVALIEICDQWLIVGVGTENITLISKLDRPPDVAESDDIAHGNGNRFLSLLQNRGFRQPLRKMTEMGKNAKS